MSSMQKYWSLPELYALDPQSGSDWLSDQFKPIEFLQSPERHEKIHGPTIYNNEDIWLPVLDEEFPPGIEITLRDFLMSEWFPRSPGLFYTGYAKSSRENAMHYVVKEDFDLNIWMISGGSLVRWKGQLL